MKKCLALVCIACLVLTAGCATIYEGFTVVRIKAKKFSGQAGPFHTFEGENVDASIIRKMSLTGDKDRVLELNPEVSMSTSGNDSTFDIKDKTELEK